MTFRTSGRGRGDSACGFSGFRVTRISGTLDSRRDARPSPWCQTLYVVPNVGTGRHTAAPAGVSSIHERSRRAGGNAVPLIRSFCAGTHSSSGCFEILWPGHGYRSPNRGPGEPILSTPAPRRSSGVKAGRPASRQGSFGPHRDHRCCQERTIRRAAAKGGQGGVRRLQAAEAALKDQRQFKRLLVARRRRDRLELLVLGAEKSSGKLHDPAQTSWAPLRQLPLPKMRVAVLPKMRVTELRDAPPVLGKFTW
jgi:hypothetical protein